MTRNTIESLCAPPKLKLFVLKRAKKKIFFLPVVLIVGAVLFKFFSPFGDSTENVYFAHVKGPCPDFIGRQEYLDTLNKNLSCRKNNLLDPVKIQVLWGKGGFGKSELAIQFANQHLSDYSIIWTFCCDSEELQNQGYRNLAEKLNVLVPQDPPDRIKEKVHFFLENHTFKLPWLLIFDNVENELVIYPQRGGAILITSQKKILNPDYLLEIRPFSREESLQLLEKISHEKRSVAMQQLVDDLDGIPLLINHAAHYMKATECGVDKYQNLFSSYLLKKEGPLWKKMDVNHRYLKSLSASWQFPLKSLEKENPKALEWLYICSYLYAEHICEEWIGDWLGEDPKSQIERKEILKVLQTYGIIRYEEKTKSFSLHRFFQHMIRENRKDHTAEDLGAAVSFLGNYVIDKNFEHDSHWKEGEFWFLHACELQKWLGTTKFSEDKIKRSEALLQEGIGWRFYNHFCFSQALDAMNQAVDFHLSRAEKDLAILCRLYIRIGKSLSWLGRYEEALAVCDKAQSSCQERGLVYSAILHIKGWMFEDQGEFEQAVDSHREALEIRRKFLGNDHLEVAKSLRCVSQSLEMMGKYEEALVEIEKTLEIIEKTCGKNHHLYNVRLGNRAWILCSQGYYSQALKIFERILQRRLVSLNQKLEPDLAFYWEGIGRCHYYLGNFKKSRKALKKSLKIGLPYWGENSAAILRVYSELGWSYLKDKHVKKGLEYLKLQLEISAKLYPNKPRLMLNMQDYQKALEEVKDL